MKILDRENCHAESQITMTPPNIQHHHYNNCVGSLNTRLSCMVAPKENVFQDREKMVTGGWTMNGRGDNWVK